MDAQNTFQVFDWLWSSGQLSEHDIDKLPGLGIDAVINLALPSSSNALPREAEIITGKGICYFQIPVAWESPEIYQLQLFFNLLDALKGQKVWVHCAMNMRVSVFIYLYRKLRLNEGEASAIYPMQHIWQPNEVWLSFIRRADLTCWRLGGDVRLLVPDSSLDKVIELEKSLHKLEVRRDRARIEQLLHSGFCEAGRSGRTYTRDEVIAELVDERNLPEIASYDFKGSEIGQNIWLITYRSDHKSPNGEVSRRTARTSIWVATNGIYQLRFHQGTALD